MLEDWHDTQQHIERPDDQMGILQHAAEAGVELRFKKQAQQKKLNGLKAGYDLPSPTQSSDVSETEENHKTRFMTGE